MPRRVLAALAASFALAAAPAAAQDEVLPTPAKNAVILDYDTGLVLFSKNAEEPMPPASMSKLMTMLIVFERLESGSLKLTDEVTVSVDAWTRGGWKSGSSNMCLKPGAKVTVEDLIRGVVVLSGNDACIALAERISGSEAAFADEMTRRARELGLTTATFKNATGWPHPEHRISARDLAELARVLIREHPDYFPIYAEREFGYCVESPENRFNRNPLLGAVEGADGLKTGHTKESGYGLVGTGLRDGKRRIFVINGLGSETERASEAKRILEASFRDFETHQLFQKGDVVGTAPVLLGLEKEVKGRIEEAVTLGYLRRRASDATVVWERPQSLKAPVKEGALLGEVVIKVPGAPERRVPVTAAAAVAKAGLVDRAMAGFRRTIGAYGDE